MHLTIHSPFILPALQYFHFSAIVYKLQISKNNFYLFLHKISISILAKEIHDEIFCFLQIHRMAACSFCSADPACLRFSSGLGQL